MGWNNPPVRWADLERALSGQARPGHRDGEHPGDGGDSPAWTRHRDRYQPPPLLSPAQTRDLHSQPRIPYAELHCHSNFSFLDGASHPEELVEEAARLGLDAIAITDHDGMYGVVRFSEAARELGVGLSSERNCPCVFPRPRVGYPTRRVSTCSCWPAILRVTAGCPG